MAEGNRAGLGRGFSNSGGAMPAPLACRLPMFALLAALAFGDRPAASPTRRP